MSAGGAGNPAAKANRSPLVPPNDNFSEDELVVKSFIDLVQQKIDDKILRAPTGAEQSKLKEAVLWPGFYVGCAVGIAQFVALRKAPIMLMRRIQSNHGHNPNFKESNVIKPFSLLFDAALSTAMAGTVWVIATDKEKLYRSASDIPLIEGRSDISDVLCTDFIAQYNNIRPEFWKENRDDALTAIREFVDNCTKRQAFERRLRREAGLGPNDPVSIPSGGVPRDFVDDEEGEADWANLEEFEEDDGSEESFWTGR